MAKYLISFPSAAMVVPDDEWEVVDRDAHAVIGEAKAAGVSAAYGWQVHARVLPLLNPASNHSILHGDLNDEALPDNWISTALQIHLRPSGHPFRLVGGNQLFLRVSQQRLAVPASLAP